MHTFKVLYEDGKNIRRLVEVELPDAFQVIGIQKYTDFEKANGEDEKELPNGTYPVISGTDFDRIYGRLLTLCDAAFTNDKQREAFKDMLKTTLSDWHRRQVDYTFTMAEQLNKLKKQ